MKRDQIGEFWRNRIWTLRLTGAVFVLFSPMIIPVWILYKNREDIIECWNDIIETFEKIDD